MPAPNERTTGKDAREREPSLAINKDTVRDLAADAPTDAGAVKGGAIPYSGVACHKDPNPGDE